MLAKIEFFEVYRVLWVLEFVDTDLEDHHLQIKYFTSIKAARVSVGLSRSGRCSGAELLGTCQRPASELLVCGRVMTGSLAHSTGDCGFLPGVSTPS